MTEISDRELNELRRQAAENGSDRALARRIIIGCCAVIVTILLVILAWKLVTPRINLYKSNTEKQAVIKEQEAISEAAVFAAEKRVIQASAEAKARLIEAQAIADSQKLIAATLTPEYLQWRYYEVLAVTNNQIIYVPTEAGLPITEANRLPAKITGGG